MYNWLAICMIQSALDSVYICDMHLEADHSHRKVEDSTVSCDKPDQPHGNAAINGIVSVYDEASILIVLKDVLAVC